MTKIALTAAAALLVATSGAFARGSDHFSGDEYNQPAAQSSTVNAPQGSLDRFVTGSINRLDSGNKAVSQSAPDDSQGIWGR